MVTPVLVRRLLVALLAGFVLVTPVVYYRSVYTHAKRLREVTPGVMYRSGQMTAAGFIDAVERYGFRTIINLQDEYPDPDLTWHYFGGGTIAESELCQRLTVRYVWLAPDIVSRRNLAADRPRAIDRFLEIMDDPTNYPVLIHCRAGLHRTGVLGAVYHMEYEHWSPAEALRDLKANGFGDFAATAANDYIVQYILTYRPGLRRAAGEAKLHPVGAREACEPDLPVHSAYEPNGIQLGGESASRRDQVVRKFTCTIPAGLGAGKVTVLRAAEAHYAPASPEGDRPGGWTLTGAEPAGLADWEHTEILDPIAPGTYFLRTTAVDFEALTRENKSAECAGPPRRPE